MAEKVICGGGDGAGHEAHWRDDRTCSFCGSLHPDEFMAYLEASTDPESPVWIDQTTKHYKRYVNGTDRSGVVKFYTWHMPDQAWVDRANELHRHSVRVSQSKMERHVNSALKEAGVPVADQPSGDVVSFPGESK